MMRFSIWSDMPSPWRPPMVLASSRRGDGVGILGAVEGYGEAFFEADGDLFGLDV